MNFSFLSFGHPNITAKHKNTLEFTKDKDLTLSGDCIIGVNSDFDLSDIKNLINHLIKHNKKKIKIIVQADDLKEEINCDINPKFSDDKEIVIRKSDFISKRTFGINANKVCKDLTKEFVEKLKNKDTKIGISITDI